MQYCGCLDSLVIFVIKTLANAFLGIQSFVARECWKVFKIWPVWFPFQLPLMHQSSEKLYQLYWTKIFGLLVVRMIVWDISVSYPFCINLLKILINNIESKTFALLVIRFIVSVAWVAHIVIYLLINPPLHPFLNEVFIKLDDLWGNVECPLVPFASFSLFFFLCLMNLIFVLLCHFSRSSGHCSICILLFLPSACSDCRCNDAGSEIGFHYNSSHEVMNSLLAHSIEFYA